MGWPGEVLDVLEEGLGMLEGISNRLVGDLEEEKILTIEDLLQQSPARLQKIATLGDKSWERLLASLRLKGFKRHRFHKIDSSKPLYVMFEGCTPRRDDLMDILDETPVVDENLEMFSHQEALERSIKQLEGVQTWLGPDIPDEKRPSYRELGEMLDWIIYYMATREIEPPEERKESNGEGEDSGGGNGDKS